MKRKSEKIARTRDLNFQLFAPSNLKLNRNLFERNGFEFIRSFGVYLIQRLRKSVNKYGRELGCEKKGLFTYARCMLKQVPTAQQTRAHILW